MTIFRRCPSCGSDAVKADSAKSILCGGCGFVYFSNAAPAAAALITNTDNELLVAVRKNEPGKGLWDLPGGFVDPGETVEGALRREMREELNLQIQSLRYFASAPNEYVYKDVTYSTVDLAFICRVEDFSELAAMDDIEKVVFIPLDKIDPGRFCFASCRRIVAAFIESQTASP